MDWISGLIILVLFILLVLAIEKVDERAATEIGEIKLQLKELKHKHNLLVKSYNHNSDGEG